MVRAIDAQQVMLQLDHMGKVQQVQQQHAEMQQRYFDVQQSEQRRLLQKKVKDTDETSKTLIENKEHEKRSGSNRRDAHEEEDHQGETEPEETQRGGNINITV